MHEETVFVYDPTSDQWHEYQTNESQNWAELVEKVKKTVGDSIVEHLKLPTEVGRLFAPFRSLVNGVEAKRVRRAIAGRHDCHSVSESLSTLTLECKQLRQRIQDIHEAANDAIFFPLFEVRCDDVKDKLIDIMLFK